jgi:hypothetical protein
MSKRSYEFGRMLAIACMSMCLVGVATAQEKILFGAVGYGLGSGQNLVGQSLVYDSQGEVLLAADKYLIVGDAARLRGGFEFPLSNRLSIRLGSEFAFMPELEMLNEYPSPRKPDLITVRNRFISLNAVLMLSKQASSIRLLFGFGPGLFFNHLTREQHTYGMEFDWIPGFNRMVEYNNKIEYSYKTAVGYNGIFGAERSLSHRATLFAELQVQYVHFDLDKMEVVEATAASRNMLVQLDVDPATDGYQKVLRFDEQSRQEQPVGELKGENMSLSLGFKVHL